MAVTSQEGKVCWCYKRVWWWSPNSPFLTGKKTEAPGGTKIGLWSHSKLRTWTWTPFPDFRSKVCLFFTSHLFSDSYLSFSGAFLLSFPQGVRVVGNLHKWSSHSLASLCPVFVGSTSPGEGAGSTMGESLFHVILSTYAENTTSHGTLLRCPVIVWALEKDLHSAPWKEKHRMNLQIITRRDHQKMQQSSRTSLAWRAVWVLQKKCKHIYVRRQVP